jgi:antitoxin CcdA
MTPAKSVGKSAVDLLLDVHLLDEAQRMNIDIAETLEVHLRGLVRTEREKRWAQDNRAAIASINAFIDRHGLLASRLRPLPERLDP